ncbi:MAG: uroporphyrinogen-III C-methyltransferase [Burkholderiaceae bacterium]|nr:uroporphyrinogen-III C-methyltransferase [Burkholderiaceae bacterium]
MNKFNPGATAGRLAGRVWLVGAGPGDPELITLKAVRVLGLADVILLDDLANSALLTHAGPRARVIRVGKRGGCRSTPQAFITRLMVREASRGRQVVRLKGGDPSVFGRAAEEIDACRRAGIAFEIVPGITSASAAAAALGTPLTDRDHARGVAFVTGHAKPGGPDPDWAALAASGLTLVVYMGLSRAQLIADALLAAGRPPGLPVAIVERASLPGERVIPTTLAGLADTLVSQAVLSPAVLVVGEALDVALAAVAEPLQRVGMT